MTIRAIIIPISNRLLFKINSPPYRYYQASMKKSILETTIDGKINIRI